MPIFLPFPLAFKKSSVDISELWRQNKNKFFPGPEFSFF